MQRTFTKVGVVGLGTMGAGIVEVFARSGLRSSASRSPRPLWPAAAVTWSRSTARAVKRGKLTEDEKDAIFERITFSTSLEDLADVELVIEAIPEHLDLKQATLATLDKILAPHAILATNTSSLSVTEISVATTRPAQVVGMHFFNPAPVQKLVEVIRTVVTDQKVIDDVKSLAAQLGKTPVVVGDKAGFIANALLFGYLNHAVALYESRYATREDIDAAMKLGCGLPMGPLALLDLIGLDTAYEILDTMYRAVARPAARPGADAQADGHGGSARPQDRTRLLHLRDRGQPRGRRRTRSRRTPWKARCPARATYAPSGSSAPGPWPSGSSRSSPRRATTSCS